MAADDTGNKKKRSFRWWPIWVAIGAGVLIATVIAISMMQLPQDGTTQTAQDEPGIQEGPGLADRPLVGDQVEDQTLDNNGTATE